MTEPVTAVDVIERALDGWIDDMLDEDRVSMPQNETIVAALREACGGGDIVIRTDGTLATLKHATELPHNVTARWRVVPVERGV